MFNHLDASPPDAILELMQSYRADPRENKIDLGVGVYRDGTGVTPIMQAVKKAEAKLHEQQNTKVYVTPAGDPVFDESILDLVFGADRDRSRLKAAQTPGGSGALRILCDLLAASSPGVTTWVSDPTWPNHLPLLQQAGHKIVRYPYYDAKRNQVDFDAMMSSLGQAAEGDIVLLHGCCHNPTGADLDMGQWEQLAALCNERGLFPFFDQAYQGFANGLEEDAAAIRLFARTVPEMVVATSCSKNLALYRDRVGAAMILGANETAAANAFSKLTSCVRANYSMPPDHGAALTQLIFEDDGLRSEWVDELDSMRDRMRGLREEFSEAMRRRTNSDRFDYVAKQNGMFSRLPLTPEQINILRERDGIYMVGDGRINVAGLPQGNMDYLADKIASVME